MPLLKFNKKCYLYLESCYKKWIFSKMWVWGSLQICNRYLQKYIGQSLQKQEDWHIQCISCLLLVFLEKMANWLNLPSDYN